MTGFREQGSGIPLMLLHGISSGAASWHKQMALPGYRVLAWDMPGYGESPMLAAASGECRRLRRCAGAACWTALASSKPCWSAIRWARWWPAAFAAKYPRAGCFTWCSPTSAQGYGQAEAATAGTSLAGTSTADSAGRRGRWRRGGRQNCCAPAAREADVATVAAGMRQAASAKATSPPPGCWRMTTSTAGLTEYRRCVSRCVLRRAGRHHADRRPAQGAGAALRRPLHRRPAGWTCQLSR